MMPYRCGSCQRVIYNRRRVTCEFCLAVIPKSQQLTDRQRAAIDRLRADEARAHREFMTRGGSGVEWAGAYSLLDGVDLSGVIE